MGPELLARIRAVGAIANRDDAFSSGPVLNLERVTERTAVSMRTPRADVGRQVSVVVITRNRLEEALATVERLRRLPEQPPIIVVDNGSRDGTAEALARLHMDVKVLRLPRNRGGGARTVGVRQADTPYVAFCDDDSWWAPGSLARGVEVLHEHPSLAVLAARILVGPEERLDPTCGEMAASPLPQHRGLPGPAVLGFVACGSILRRDAYLAAGGFEPRLGVGGEEELLAIDLASAGWGLAYVDEVVAHHHPSPSRDPGRRRRTVVRNGLWIAWLRRPFLVAARRTIRVLREARRDAVARAALVEAVRHGGWLIPRRRRVPPEVERRLRLLERARAGSVDARVG